MGMAVVDYRTDVCVPWAEADDIAECGPCGGVVESIDPDQVTEMLVVASDLLFRLSGGQFNGGGCEETVRPCCADDLCTAWDRNDFPYRPELIDGEWYNVGPSRACLVRGCGTDLAQIPLGRWPVTEVTAVTIDGAAFSDWRLDDQRWLVRTDGDHWPVGQDLLLADTEAGTWSVEFTWGLTPPVAGMRAAAELACHLLLLCAGSEACRLPIRATRVTRQGVTFDIGDVQDLLSRGSVGLFFVDLFLHTYNPNRLQERPVVTTVNRQSWRRG